MPIIWKVSRPSDGTQDVLSGPVGAREGKEVKKGFLEPEGLPTQVFTGFEGGKMTVVIISVTLALSTW